MKNNYVVYHLHSDYSLLDSCTDFKDYIKDIWGGLKYFRPELRDYVKLVQDFDKLCDEIREYVNVLSTTNYALDSLYEIVEFFNDVYREDLEYLHFNKLEVESEKVYVGEIKKLKSNDPMLAYINDDIDFNGILCTEAMKKIIRAGKRICQFNPDQKWWDTFVKRIEKILDKEQTAEIIKEIDPKML